MFGVPRSAALLTALGLLPFIAGAWISTAPTFDGALNTYPLIIAKDGEGILLLYGKIILSFMGGCLWGFGARAEPANSAWYLLSVFPALWAFLMVGQNLWMLALGFVLLLGLDLLFQSASIAPNWWMKLRIPVSSVVIICIAIGAIQ